MKRDATYPQWALARRGWLYAIVATAGSQLLSGARRVRGASATPPPPASARPRLVVRPAPDSVKRHG